MICIKTENTAQKTAFLALLCAIAIIFSYVESLIPVSIVPIPGFKLGFSNIVILQSIYLFGLKDSLIINTTKAAVVALLFSSITSFMFSIAGGTAAVITMYFVCKSKLFSIYSVGVSGAVLHNIGQVVVAYFILGSEVVFAYLPYLLLCSLVCGIFISLICGLIMKRIKVVKQ